MKRKVSLGPLFRDTVHHIREDMRASEDSWSHQPIVRQPNLGTLPPTSPEVFLNPVRLTVGVLCSPGP